MAQATYRVYVRIGTILAMLTAIEFGVLYVAALQPIAVLILVALGIAKFFLVVQFFMHLRYEHAALKWIFVGGVTLAVALWIAVWAIFYYRIPETLP